MDDISQTFLFKVEITNLDERVKDSIFIALYLDEVIVVDNTYWI